MYAFCIFSMKLKFRLYHEIFIKRLTFTLEDQFENVGVSGPSIDFVAKFTISSCVGDLTLRLSVW